jgi:hypothetical protein
MRPEGRPRRPLRPQDERLLPSARSDQPPFWPDRRPCAARSPPGPDHLDAEEEDLGVVAVFTRAGLEDLVVPDHGADHVRFETESPAQTQLRHGAHLLPVEATASAQFDPQAFGPVDVVARGGDGQRPPAQGQQCRGRAGRAGVFEVLVLGGRTVGKEADAQTQASQQRRLDRAVDADRHAGAGAEQGRLGLRQQLRAADVTGQRVDVVSSPCAVGGNERQQGESRPGCCFPHHGHPECFRRFCAGP